MTVTDVRWTVGEYRRMTETGILNPDERLDTWFDTRQVYVFREPHEGNYQLETIFNQDDVLSMLAFPEIEVQISRLFP